MIGPRKKIMPWKYVCTGCDMLIKRHLGGTQRFPDKRSVCYCTNFPENEISFIKGFPYTPKWCPVLRSNKHSEKSFGTKMVRN